MSVDEEGRQRPGAEWPHPSPPADPDAERPTDTRAPAGSSAEPPAGAQPSTELSPEELRRLRARLARKYH
jgi:hypothetical protein